MGQRPRKLLHEANADIQGKVIRSGNDADDLGTKFAGAVPKGRCGLLKNNPQIISRCVFAMTAKAQARCRKINSHSFFEPRNHLRTHANGDGQGTTLAAATLGLVEMSIAVRERVRVLFKLNGNGKSRGSITASEGAVRWVCFGGILFDG